MEKSVKIENEVVKNVENVELVKKEVKMRKKVLKEVEYEKVVNKKGYFSVKEKDSGEVILWAVRVGGDYCYYVVKDDKREVGLNVLRKLMKNEELKKDVKKDEEGSDGEPESSNGGQPQ